MILFGCPVGIRHLSRIIVDQFRRVYHRKCPRPASKIHFVYFSCARDMELLKLSLSSLACLTYSKLGNTFIVVDSKGPFSHDQQAELKGIIQDLIILELGQIDWASVKTLETELKAFGIASNMAQPNDFIAKVDSDILFFDSTKLDEISICSKDFVGDGHYSDYQYAQGGLYFIRAHLAQQLLSVTTYELEEAISRCRTVAEDQVISALIRQRTNKIWLTRLMLFPNEYEKTNLQRNWVRMEFTAIHFVHRKQDMSIYATQLGII